MAGVAPAWLLFTVAMCFYSLGGVFVVSVVANRRWSVFFYCRLSLLTCGCVMCWGLWIRFLIAGCVNKGCWQDGPWCYNCYWSFAAKLGAIFRIVMVDIAVVSVPRSAVVFALDWSPNPLVSLDISQMKFSWKWPFFY